MRIEDASLYLQQEYDMFINGGVASNYDEEDSLTYWATVHNVSPPAMCYAVRPLPHNQNETFHAPV